MNPSGPRVVIPSTKGRDTLIAVTVGVVLLGFVLYGLLSLGKKHQPRNIVVGIVTEKQMAPRREEQISFHRSKITGTKQSDGDYTLKVRVEAENRTYEVPVEKPLYENKRVGDKLEFVRPPSEQR